MSSSVWFGWTSGTPSDYHDWRTHFGQTTGPAAAMRLTGNVVSEPASFTLALVASAACAVMRLRWHRKEKSDDASDE